MNIRSLLYTIEGNKRHIDRYLKFIAWCASTNIISMPLVTEKHHICPRSLFPEYKNIRKHPWNIIHLSLRQHFVAHYILHKAYGGKMTYAAFCMSSGLISPRSKNKINEDCSRHTIPSRLYEEVKTARKMMPSPLKGRKFSDDRKREMLGKVTCINTETNEILKVTKHEFDTNDVLVGIRKGIKPSVSFEPGISRPNFTGKIHSEKSKKAISETIKEKNKKSGKRITVNNGTEQTLVCQWELDSFLRKGYVLGRLLFKCSGCGKSTTAQNIAKLHKRC